MFIFFVESVGVFFLNKYLVYWEKKNRRKGSCGCGFVVEGFFRMCEIL